MNVAVAPAEERDALSAALESLENLRQCLVQAQETEAAASQHLNDLTVAGAEVDMRTLEEAHAAAHLARLQSLAAYETVSRAIERFNDVAVSQNAHQSAGSDLLHNATAAAAFSADGAGVPSLDEAR